MLLNPGHLDDAIEELDAVLLHTVAAAWGSEREAAWSRAAAGRREWDAAVFKKGILVATKPKNGLEATGQDRLRVNESMAKTASIAFDVAAGTSRFTVAPNGLVTGVAR